MGDNLQDMLMWSHQHHKTDLLSFFLSLTYKEESGPFTFHKALLYNQPCTVFLFILQVPTPFFLQSITDNLYIMTVL